MAAVTVPLPTSIVIHRPWIPVTLKKNHRVCLQFDFNVLPIVMHLPPLTNNPYMTTDAVHARNIRAYKEYLETKIRAYSENHVDYLKPAAEHKAGRLRHLSIGNGLLKETQVLQRQLAAILRTQVSQRSAK